MKLPDKENFNFKECEVAGDKCWLITPKDIRFKWSEDTLIFRSIIITQNEHRIVSMGFPKFFNFNEQPDIDPWDNERPFTAIHKIDGSLLIVSKHCGRLIVRTRGTIDARLLPNGNEIVEVLMKKYPMVFNNHFLNNKHSILLEWTTPSNIICIRESDEPELTLVGMIYHPSENNLYFHPQFALDNIAPILGVKRPHTFKFNSLTDCLKEVELWKDKEGVVLYQENGFVRPKLRKVKSDWYCELHKLATGIRNVNQVFDLYLQSPRYLEWKRFYSYIETVLDYEIAKKLEDHIKTVCQIYTKIKVVCVVLEDNIDKFVRPLTTRKEQAERIMDLSKVPWETAFCFATLDNRTIDDKLYRKAFEYYLKHYDNSRD